MALYIPHSILHLARLLYVRPENLDPTTYIYLYVSMYVCMYIQKVTISCLNRATVNNISSPVNPPEAAHTHTTEAAYTHALSPLEAAHSHHTLSPPEAAHTRTTHSVLHSSPQPSNKCLQTPEMSQYYVRASGTVHSKSLQIWSFSLSPTSNPSHIH